VLIIVYGPPETEPRYTLYPTTVDSGLHVKVAECWTGTLTVTLAVADFVASAALTAFTVKVPAVLGAV